MEEDKVIHLYENIKFSKTFNNYSEANEAIKLLQSKKVKLVITMYIHEYKLVEKIITQYVKKIEYNRNRSNMKSKVPVSYPRLTIIGFIYNNRM